MTHTRRPLIHLLRWKRIKARLRARAIRLRIRIAQADIAAIDYELDELPKERARLVRGIAALRLYLESAERES